MRSSPQGAGTFLFPLQEAEAPSPSPGRPNRTTRVWRAAVKRAPHGAPDLAVWPQVSHSLLVGLSFPSCAVGRGRRSLWALALCSSSSEEASFLGCLPAPPSGHTSGPWFGPRLPKLQDALCFAGGETEAVGTKRLKRGWVRTQAPRLPRQGHPALPSSLPPRQDGRDSAPAPEGPLLSASQEPPRGEHCWGPKGTAVLMPSPSSSQEAQCPQGQPVTRSSLRMHEVQYVSETTRQQGL